MYHEHGPEVAEAARSRLHPALAAAMNAERTSPGGPEQVEAERRTQIRWVRPTELAMQGGARATGWGLDLRAELAQRLRDARADRKQDRAEQRAVRSERASRLPDLSIRGRRRQTRPEPARSGMGLR